MKNLEVKFENFHLSRLGTKNYDQNDITIRKRNFTPDLSNSIFEQKKYQDLIEKITFSSETYIYDYNFAPGIQFYKFLTNYPESQNILKELKIWVPDTVIFNDLDNPNIWIFTNHIGNIQYIKGFSDYDVINKIGVGDNEKELCAVLKRPQINQKLHKISGLKTTILNTIDLKKQIKGKSVSGPFAIQKYVKSKGPLAFHCRTVYKRSQKHFLWVISNKKTYQNEKIKEELRCITNITVQDSFTIRQFKSGIFLDETIPYIETIVKSLENKLDIEIEEFAADFIKDENQRWWFIGCKAFLIKEHDISGLLLNESEILKPFPKEKIKTCRICQVPYYPFKMNHSLTIKMITETDQILRERGINLKWLDRSVYRQVDIATVYQDCTVCEYCYELYSLNQEVKNLTNKISRKFGIPYSDVLTQNFVMVGKSENPQTKELKIGRILVVLNEVCDIVVPLKKESEYCIKYEILGYKQEIYLQVKEYAERNLKFIPINDIKIFHFFMKSRDKWKKFINTMGKFNIKLYKDDIVIGECNSDLSSFFSPIVITKNYYDLILSNKGEEIGFLKFSIGFDESKKYEVPLENVKYLDGLYIPPEGYSFSHPFHEEWIDIIPNVSDYNRQIFQDYGITVKPYVKAEERRYSIPPRLSQRRDDKSPSKRQPKRSSTPKAVSSKTILKALKTLQPLLDTAERSFLNSSMRTSLTPTLSTYSTSLVSFSRSSTPRYTVSNFKVKLFS
ncbi:unnamed protein product [Blepharisma stoltei]|uniref:Uncharacterized protein n=1 Tax=Blepharisma stoltei TaxID=1481888 RepID=A0AAU9II67_9CILI|nr:unnamed protein product [Blepharisma stoltei]